MKKGVSYIIVLVLIAAVLFFLYSSGPRFTGFAVFEQITQTDFNEGIYQNIIYDTNLSAVVLNVNQTSGTYTSKVFGNGSELQWNNFTSIGSEGLIFEVTTCSDENCSDSNFTSNVSLSNLNITGLYLQYRVFFDASITNETLSLTSVTINYSPLALEPEPSCSDDLSLCSNETECTDIGGGYWYDDVCEEPSCSNNLDLCEDEESCTDIGGGYWYDDVCNAEEEIVEEIITEIPPMITALSAEDIQNLKLNPGSSQEITWVVKNTGTMFIGACVFVPFGDYAKWISSSTEEIKNLTAGEQKIFVFNISVPEDAGDGSYLLGVSVGCLQKTVSKEFTLQVEKKKLEFDVISADRTREDRIRIIYSVSELIGEDQDIGIYFSLLDTENQEVASVEENRSITANSAREFRVNMLINESLEGNFSLATHINSEIYTTSVLTPITLGAPIGGFAIFGEGGLGTGGIIILVIVILALGVVLFFARRMRKSEKTLKDIFRFRRPQEQT